MCGIYGIIDFSENMRIDKQVLRKMNSKSQDRGPVNRPRHLGQYLLGIGIKNK